MKLHEKLYQLRKQKSLTQAEVAEILDVSRQSVSNWESGTIEPSMKRLKMLSQLYEVSLDYLVREEEEPNTDEIEQRDFLSQSQGEEPVDKIEGGANGVHNLHSGFYGRSVKVGVDAVKQKRMVCFVLLAVVIVLCVGAVMGLIWWSNQPSRQFYYWEEELSMEPEFTGISLTITSATRNKDGSGSLAYTLENSSKEVKYWGPNKPWIDYADDDGWHTVYPKEEVETFEVKQANSLDANVSKNFVEAFPANVLKLPGEYRFCVDGAGSVRFVVLDNGTIVVSDS